MNLDTPRAKAVIGNIFAAMETGAYFNREQIVKRFVDGGYCQRLAEKGAEALIAANTDIAHFSRWVVRGTGTQTTYTFPGK